MMNWVWFGLIAVSIGFGIATGHMNAVSQAAISGAQEAVTLFLLLLATICLWNGLMKIAEKSGVTNMVQKLLSPLTKRLFRELDPHGPAMRAISMNMTANLLGLGNAATPLGLKAMKELSKLSADKKTASNSMVTFVVVNTASVQLIPTTIAAIRIKYGAAAPFDILPATLLASAATLCFGVALCRSLEKSKKGS